MTNSTSNRAGKKLARSRFKPSVAGPRLGVLSKPICAANDPIFHETPTPQGPKSGDAGGVR